MTTNPFVSLFERSYQQNKANIKNKLAAYVPEITNHTESEIFVRDLSVFYGLVEMLGVNGDKTAKELFVNHAELFSSLVDAAFNYDYRVKGALSATVNMRFILAAVSASSVTIPAGTEVSNGSVSYFTVEELIIPPGDIDGFVDAIQEQEVTGVNIGSTDGSMNQVIELIADFIVDNSISIDIAGDAWFPEDTLARHLATEKVFVSSINGRRKTQVRFGDNLTGAIPATGEVVTAAYKITQGQTGNLGPSTITTIVSTVTVPTGVVLTCNNVNEASGGADIESLSLLARNLPLFIRTLDRAVSEQDYIDIATIAPGVAKGGVDYHCGKVVDVYVAPVGGGIATQSLLDDVLDWFNDGRRMLTTKINTRASGEVNLIIVAQVNLLASANKSVKSAEIKASLEAFYSVENQEIKGSAFLSDIYQIIETTVGVQNSNVSVMNTIPYAFIKNGTSPLLWDVETLIGSNSTIHWRIVIINATDYQLIKDGSFIGTHTIGIQVSLTEVEFTVNASSYSVGDQWEFTTYKYFGNVQLDEMSIIVANAANITLNMVGGI